MPAMTAVALHSTFALVLALAQQSSSRYPESPPGLPPALALPGSDAATAADMRAYTERIPGTEASFDMLPIPAGVFRMGSPDGEEGRGADEGPQHAVALDA